MSGPQNHSGRPLLLRGAVIFDRDGILNEDVGYPHKPEQIRWIPGAIDAVREVNRLGLFAFVATNQAGIAHGYYDEAAVQALHAWMAEKLARHGARIDAFVYSPYHPEARLEAYRRNSLCRKPGPGMILDLLRRFPVDPARVLMVGDKPSDIQAAVAAGIKGVLFEGGSLLDALRPELARLAGPET